MHSEKYQNNILFFKMSNLKITLKIELISVCLTLFSKLFKDPVLMFYLVYFVLITRLYECL